MNNWKEKYPNNIEALLKENIATIASNLEGALNSSDCPILSSLYQKNDKIIRLPTEFERLNYFPNIRGSKKVKSNNEFKGLYVFGQQSGDTFEPVYVGISRAIYRRLRQHGWGTAHNQCTLAYLIAIDKFHSGGFNKERKELPEEHLKYGKDEVRNFKVALYSVPEDYNLYFLEVALAGYWKTKWNSFRTH